MRIGHGYDLHKYTQGDHITLAGTKVPCEYAIVAHSDGDVVLHAICDALLGAAALGDIGQLFPDTDPKNANRASSEFIAATLKKVESQHLTLSNIDVTIVAQAPKLQPYMDEMRKNLANLLQSDQNRINIKATTTEGLGAIGQKHAIAAYAVVLLNEGE